MGEYTKTVSTSMRAAMEQRSTETFKLNVLSFMDNLEETQDFLELLERGCCINDWKSKKLNNFSNFESVVNSVFKWQDVIHMF